MPREKPVNPFPQGIPLSTITEVLTQVPDEHNEQPIDTIENFEQRFSGAAFEKYIDEMYWGKENFRPREHWRNLPPQYFENFSFDDICKMQHSSIFMTDWSDKFDKEFPYIVPQKIELSYWHYGYTKDWNLMVQDYDAIKSFSFGDGFEVGLDMSRGCSQRGWSRFTETYLDSELAFVIHKDGKHVLTIGFSPSDQGILITQIQLKEKKGNRWLYKLPCHYFEYALMCLFDAFGSRPLYLVDGTALSEYVAASYAKDVSFPIETKEHIAKLYNRDLTHFERLGEIERGTWSQVRLNFYQLAPSLSQIRQAVA